MQKTPFRMVDTPPNLFFLNIEQIQESPEPALVELCFQQTRGHSGEISPGSGLGAAGVGEALELEPPRWVGNGSPSR